MGKSNKFDYSNRKNSGIALGQVIGKALDSEADKVRKDAEKKSTRARKVSIASNFSTSDLQDYVVHHIDLQAPNKDLGDDGIRALVDGLESALRKGTCDASLALEDVNLSGNRITVASLTRLALIINLAKHDLKTINLSNNSLTVSTDDEAEQWETFLLAFKDCLKLRRLDLGNNPDLGTRAMEIFARVHVREAPVTPILARGEASVYSLSETSNLPTQASGSDEHDEEPGFGGYQRRSLALGCHLPRRCGLRSIPYISLNSVYLTDAGALWLSYALEDHYYPVQLTNELNAADGSTAIKAYQQDGCTDGIDYEGNDATLGKDGILLLQKAEAVRRQILLDDQSTLASSVVLDGDSNIFDEAEARTRASLGRRFSRTSGGDGRASLRSIRTSDGGEHELSELESARKKIQRHIIAHSKVASVDLWRAALRLLHCSRVILHDAPVSRKFYHGEATFRLPARDEPPLQLPSPPPSSPYSSACMTIDVAKSSASPAGARSTYAATLFTSPSFTPGKSEMAATSCISTPTNPKIAFKAPRKDVFCASPDTTPLTAKLSKLGMHDRSPYRYIRYQQTRTARDTNTRSHLPGHILDYIVQFVMSQRELDLLSEEQRRAVFDWGQRRDTLMLEREWMKRDEASQVWMLLDGMGCVAYGQ